MKNLRINHLLRLSLFAATILIGLASTSQVHAAVLAEYTLNSTNRLTATSVDANLSASAFGIVQSEDPDGGTLNDDTYQFTADGLMINRSTSGAVGWGTDLAAPFSFTISADNGFDVEVESLTMVSRSNTHNLAYRFGTSNTSDEYTAFHTFGLGGGTDTRTLTSPFIITAGTSKTFYIDMNSANGNSTHDFGTFTVNGTVIPEPSIALLGSLGLLILLRRRRCH